MRVKPTSTICKLFFRAARARVNDFRNSPPIDASRGLQINRARVIEPNIECRNGVIHVIDSVLTLKQRSKARAGRFAAR
jgi:hypothetical protein